MLSRLERTIGEVLNGLTRASMRRQKLDGCSAAPGAGEGRAPALATPRPRGRPKAARRFYYF